MPNPSKLSNSLSGSEIEKPVHDAIEENWFDYPVTVYPHHTDYGGVVWHGTYLPANVKEAIVRLAK